MVQLKEPSFGVLEDNVCTTTPDLRTSIFTFVPTSPDDVHIIGWMEPRCQASPPLGEVTVIPEINAKLLLLESVMDVVVLSCDPDPVSQDRLLMRWKWSSLKEPSFGVLEDNVCTTTPDLRTSIFTFDPTSPVDVHRIAWVEPRCQTSPPYGEVTLISR